MDEIKKTENIEQSDDIIQNEVNEQNAVREQEVVDSKETIFEQPLASEVTPISGSIKDDARWYALHTFTGYETMAAENLRRVVEKNNLQHVIFDIIIPMEDVIEEKKGKRVLVSRKTMPGYILIKMNYDDAYWHTVTRTHGITGFVGPNGRALPLPNEEVQKLKLEKIKIDVNIKAGDKIQIVDGPLESQIGDVTSVDLNNGKVRVVVNMFGREMPVDLDLSQIKII